MRFLAALAIDLFLTGAAFAGSSLLPQKMLRPSPLPIAETKKKEKVEHFFKTSKIHGLPDASVQKGTQLRAAAEKGDAQAQFLLAEGLRRKVEQQKLMPPAAGGESSLAEAIGWYEEAAGQGHVKAKQRLADLYFTGEGVKPDPEKALSLYLEAANKGDALSGLRMGRAYEGGIGVKRNLDRAIHWYERASKRTGRSKPAGEARYRLGKIYSSGGDKKANFVRAYMWLDFAAKSGHRDANGARLKIEKQMSLADIVKAKKNARQWNEALKKTAPSGE